jgi:toxin ParE1/3/4
MSRIDLEFQAVAEEDIADILQYTLQRWGEEQLEAYWSILWDAFQHIRRFPDIGHTVEGRPSNIREYVLPNHVIHYQREPERVVILRIVNPRRRRR